MRLIGGVRQFVLDGFISGAYDYYLAVGVFGFLDFELERLRVFGTNSQRFTNRLNKDYVLYTYPVFFYLGMCVV